MMAVMLLILIIGIVVDAVVFGRLELASAAGGASATSPSQSASTSL